MNVPTGVLPIPSRSRVRRQSRWPLALLATLSLALVLGVVAVVLVPGGAAQVYPTIRSRRRQAHLRRRANSRQHAQDLGCPEKLQGQGHILCHRTTGATRSKFGQKRIPRGTLCTEPHLHPPRLDHPWPRRNKTRASRHKPGYQSSRRSQAGPLSPAIRTHQRQGP